MELQAIAKIHTPFRQKFGVPRQSHLLKELSCSIVFEKDFIDPNWIRGLEEISHIWVIFGFHLNETKEKNPTTRPPRLGGTQRMGVFATRSPDRPNNLGLSLVKIERIETDQKTLKVHIKGGDFVHETPIYDLKPFHPEADVCKDGRFGWIENLENPSLEVVFDLMEGSVEVSETLKVEISQILSHDPRPPHQSITKSKIYKMNYYPYEVEWFVDHEKVIVKSIFKDS
ncbi:MAG: tRNA (N6-threonylcarbamoyladenosine(37)-N6)-methyltransferase TrmO [Bacteriovoracaceae bacterium]